MEPTNEYEKCKDDSALVELQLKKLMDTMRSSKSTERGELARRYAVAITELEKLQAYFDVYIIRREYWPNE